MAFPVVSQAHHDSCTTTGLTTAVRPLQTFHYSISFEFDRLPVLTSRGVVKAAKATTGAVMALRHATDDLKPRRWRSLVVVLERGGCRG